MKRKIVALLALCIAFSMICAVLPGCKKNPDDAETTTTEPAETAYKSYFDKSEGKILIRTVSFGGNSVEIAYNETQDYGDGKVYDAYTDGKNTYKYYYNTDTFYMISIAAFGSGTISYDDSLELAINYLTGQFGADMTVNYKIQTKVQTEDTSEAYFKIIFSRLDGHKGEYSEIIMFIPKTADRSEVWFTK